MNILQREQPTMEFYEEPDYLRIEYTRNGILSVRYLEKQDAEMMLQFIGTKSTQHKGQLETV
jgi:hypothetical protein